MLKQTELPNHFAVYPIVCHACGKDSPMAVNITPEKLDGSDS